MSPNANKLTLLALATATIGSSAFVITPPRGPLSVVTRIGASSIDMDIGTPLNMDKYESGPLPYFAEIEEGTALMSSSMDATPIMKKKLAPKTGTAATKGHKAGIFTPLVIAARVVLGEKSLNKTRGKFISAHSTLIGKFIKTSDSTFGESVLRHLFDVCDKDGNCAIDEEELQIGLASLGFSWLKEKQIGAIFKRADKDGNGLIDIDEWIAEAPKTLRTNLTKLAKKNGGEMGFLS